MVTIDVKVDAEHPVQVLSDWYQLKYRCDRVMGEHIVLVNGWDTIILVSQTRQKETAQQGMKRSIEELVRVLDKEGGAK